MGGDALLPHRLSHHVTDRLVRHRGRRGSSRHRLAFGDTRPAGPGGGRRAGRGGRPLGRPHDHRDGRSRHRARAGRPGARCGARGRRHPRPRPRLRNTARQRLAKPGPQRQPPGRAGSTRRRPLPRGTRRLWGRPWRRTTTSEPQRMPRAWPPAPTGRSCSCTCRAWSSPLPCVARCRHGCRTLSQDLLRTAGRPLVVVPPGPDDIRHAA